MNCLFFVRSLGRIRLDCLRPDKTPCQGILVICQWSLVIGCVLESSGNPDSSGILVIQDAGYRMICQRAKVKDQLNLLPEKKFFFEFLKVFRLPEEKFFLEFLIALRVFGSYALDELHCKGRENSRKKSHEGG